jgi:hypothetical protein
MEGGLKMVNINAFMNAFKLTWIRRIISSDGCWISFLTQGIDVQKLVTCGKHYVEKMSKSIKNEFWKHTLNAFSLFIEHQKFDKEDICNLPLFYNHNINIGNESIFWKSWYEKGICCIYNILQYNGQFYTPEELGKIYDININHLLYLGMKKAVTTFFQNVCFNP